MPPGPACPLSESPHTKWILRPAAPGALHSMAAPRSPKAVSSGALHRAPRPHPPPWTPPAAPPPPVHRAPTDPLVLLPPIRPSSLISGRGLRRLFFAHSFTVGIARQPFRPLIEGRTLAIAHLNGLGVAGPRSCYSYPEPRGTGAKGCIWRELPNAPLPPDQAAAAPPGACLVSPASRP